MDTPKAGWFVMYTKPRHERKIAGQLLHLNINHFLPIVKTLRIWSDRRKYIDMPLFPSYIFVSLEDTHSFFKSLEIDGVLHYVKIGKQVARISETIINNLKLIIANNVQEVEVCSDVLYPGKKMVIKEGPFTGFNCEVIQHKGKQKILVRIAILQRSILLDIPVDYLMPAPVIHCQ